MAGSNKVAALEEDLANTAAGGPANPNSGTGPTIDSNTLKKKKTFNSEEEKLNVLFAFDNYLGSY